ncbi:MAG TPA: biotin/lipoyl-containing protein, partial [Sphingomicrobium sp.]|nr:biotin/lipoyl-containing protein [Sphingomicrobium sp.]
MIDIVVPHEQEGTKAVVRSWLKQIGDRVAKDDPLVELETDKVTQEVPAPETGILAEILLDSDAEAAPGAVLGRIRAGKIEEKPSARPEEEEEKRKSDRPSAELATNGGIETRLSPSVRRACLQHSIDPSKIEGSGRNGRITREDVDRAVAQATVTKAGEPATAQPRNFSAADIPHDRMRLKIAENMARAVSEQPHV